MLPDVAADPAREAQRVAEAVLHLARVAGKLDGSGLLLLPAGPEDLACLAGASAAVVREALARLERRKVLVARDPAGLRFDPTRLAEAETEQQPP
ncbi:MAG: winged helix-turn-helix domain-containing protein [Limnochordaceae bacterium]|nr:winged helix-turn-helix domain-containing protein [Limnochordaceae bacterium]